MYYFYETHMGGSFISEEYLDFDDLYCDTCGDWDNLLFSFSNREELEKNLKEEEYCSESIEESLKEFDELVEEKKYKPSKIEIKEPEEVNENGNNTKLSVKILPEEFMREFGFTDFKEGYWYYCKSVGDETTFNVSINKQDPSDFRIDVLDENFCQPYDYQSYIMSGKIFKFVEDVYNNVEDELAKLTEAGILEGHKRGEYV